MRLSLLDRYVTAEFLRLFVLFALAAPALIIIGDLTDNLDKFLSRGLTTQQVVLGYLFALPEYVLWSIPVAALIATIFTVSSMARHSEVAAAKAGGISFYRLFLPLPVLGAVFTVVALGLSELVPITIRLKSEVHGEKTRMLQSRSDFVFRTEDGIVYSIHRLDVETGLIENIAFEREGDGKETPGLSAIAVEGNYTPGTGWTLRDGYLRVLHEPGEHRTLRFHELRPVNFQVAPEQLLVKPKDPEEMRFGELSHFIEILERSGGRPLELMVERAQKISIPVATLIIVLFAAPLAMSSHRGGTAYGIGISLGITIFYLMLFKIAGAAGQTGSLPPTLAAWLPNALFLMAGAVLNARVRT